MSDTRCIRALRRFSVTALLTFVPLSAQCFSPFTLEEVRGYSFPEELVAAKRASVVAWMVNDHGHRSVWVAGGPDFKARRLVSYEKDDGQAINDLSLSADGASVVYVRGDNSGGNWEGGSAANPLSSPQGATVEIWSVSVSGGAPRRIGEGNSPNISPDGRRLAFLKDGAAWLAPVDGSSAAQRVLTIRGRVVSPTWSPDGSRLAFVASRGAYSLIGVYTDEQTPIRWLAASPSRDSSPRWSPDGKRVAFIRRRGEGGVPAPLLQFEPDPWAIWIADATTGEAKPRWSSGTTLRDSYDGRYLEWASVGAIVFESYQDGWQHLYSLPASGGDPVLLTPGQFMVEDVALAPDRKFLLVNANTGSDPDDVDRRHLYRVAVDRAGMQALTSGTGLEWSPVITGDDHLVFLNATAQRPPLLATMPINGGAVRQLAEEFLSGRNYPTRRLVEPSRVSFQANDGITVHGQLFAPIGASGTRPAVVYVHGGPPRQMLLGWHPMAYYSNDYALNQYFASRGFIVLSVNYRLGIGYGHDFQYPPNAGQRGASEYRDVQAAARYLQALPNVDGSRIGIYGGSYGGYLTAMGLAHDSAVFAVGVDIHGVHNWTADYELSQLFARRRYEVPADAERALALGWESSPVSAVASWKSPVLFIHGDDDRNVRVTQTVDLVRRLQSTGVHQETLILVDEIHNILRYENELAMDQATDEFLERHLLHQIRKEPR